MNRKYICKLFVSLLILTSVPAYAGISENIKNAISHAYVAAEQHRGLETAQEPIDAGKLRDYVVLAQGGIAAEKARWYVTNQEYDYRPVVLDIKNNKIKTRRGKIYTFLDAGEVMILAGVKYSGNTVYLRLLSAEVYENNIKEKHPSRVGVLVGLKFPNNLLNSENAEPVLTKLNELLPSFRNLALANSYAKSLKTKVKN